MRAGRAAPGMLAAPAEMQQWLRAAISPYSVKFRWPWHAFPRLFMMTRDLQLGRSKRSRRRERRWWITWRRLGVPLCADAGLISFWSRSGLCHAESWEAMHRPGALTRDRTKDLGCAGCVRITGGRARRDEPGSERYMSEVLDEIQWERT